MGSRIYVEGGGNGKDTRARCQEGFHKLLERSGYAGRRPRLVACGSRGDTYDDFTTAHANARGDYVAMLVDSEDPVTDIEQPWKHLREREYDGWQCPLRRLMLRFCLWQPVWRHGLWQIVRHCMGIITGNSKSPRCLPSKD